MITLVSFFAMLSFGLPIIALLIFASLVFVGEYGAYPLLDTFAVQSVRGIEASGFLAVPLYMLVGQLLNRGRITEKLVRSAMRLVGGMRGGLAFVNVLTNAFAAAILGSATAQIAIMTRALVPEMEKHGYDRGFATGLSVASGLLGPIIPPSMLMIIYGVLAYQSVAALFIAGLIPGLIIAAGFMITVALSRGSLPAAGRVVPIATGWRAALSDALPGLIPLVIMVGVISGAMTPTESGAVAAVVALALAMSVYRSLTVRDLIPILESVLLSSASIIALIGFATLFGWVLSYENIPQAMAEGLASVALGPVTFLVLVTAVVFLLGMFLDGIGVMIVIVPVLLPFARQFGIDPLHFGVIIAIATLTGLVTPPVGPGLYIAMDATGLGLGQVFRATLPFMAAFFVATAVILLFPALSVWLPTALGL